MKRVGINGLGRIGRIILRQYVASPRQDFEIVAVNDLDSADNLSYLIKYDSVHGRAPFEVSHGSDYMQLGERKVSIFREKDPENIPWKDEGVDIVLECSGAFRKREGATKHLKAGASKVILSAPSDDADITVVLGVNESAYDPQKHQVISNASCTTNCLAPVVKVMEDSFGIEHLWATTIHAYTSSQSLVDRSTRKRRRGRAAALSIVPTSTGAAKATSLTLPELQGKMDAIAFRVPVADGSLTDLVVALKKDASREEINSALEAAASGPLKGIVEYSKDELVSVDVIGNAHSAIVDAELTSVLGRRMAKVVVWYDNEWAYSTRMLDLTSFIISKEEPSPDEMAKREMVVMPT